MNKHETISDEMNDIKEEVSSYLQSKIDLTKLQLAEDLSRIMSSIAVKLGLLYIGIFIQFFISMAAAYAIGSYLESMESGFILVAIFYFLVGIIFYLFKSKIIQTPIIKKFIHLFFQNFNSYDQ